MSFTRKLIYIINPISGTSSKAKIKEIIISKTEAAKIWYQFFPSVADGNYSFLFDFIKDEKINTQNNEIIEFELNKEEEEKSEKERGFL